MVKDFNGKCVNYKVVCIEDGEGFSLENSHVKLHFGDVYTVTHEYSEFDQFGIDISGYTIASKYIFITLDEWRDRKIGELLK